MSVYTKPYFTTRDIILVRKESGIKATSCHDFKGLSPGCGLGYYYPEGFSEAFRKGDILREDNPAGENNLRKLALKRLYGAIVDNVQAKYMFNRCGLNPDDFEIGYQFQPSKLCLRLHKSRQDLLPALNEGIDSLTADGTIDRIVMKYSP